MQIDPQKIARFGQYGLKCKLHSPIVESSFSLKIDELFAVNRS